MIALLLTLLSLSGVIYFPTTITLLVTFVTAFFEPLVPLAVGIFSDTFYWSPGVGTLPYASIIGLFVSGIAFFVRNRLRSGSMR